MEKNKNRTDMLVAGRKKLQQYRQKKDGKGSSSQGKSSKTSNKHEKRESDTDAASGLARPPARAVEVESPGDSSQGNMDQSLSQSSETLAPDVDSATVNPSSISVAPDTGAVETVVVQHSELLVQEAVANRHNEEDAQVARTEAVATSNVPDPEKDAKTTEVSAPLVDGAGEISVTVEIENANKEAEQDALPSPENASLVQAREYHMTDDVFSLGMKQFNRSGETEPDGIWDHSSSKLGDSNESATSGETGMDDAVNESGLSKSMVGTDAMIMLDGISVSSTTEQTPVDDATHEAEQSRNTDGASPSSGPINISEESSVTVTALPGADGVSAVDPTMINQQKDGVATHSFDVEKSEVPLESRGTVGDINFLQLMELVRQLGENEFRLLLKARESESCAELGTGSLSLSDNSLVEMEKLTQELYLSNCAKDIFQLQLTAQSDLLADFDHQRHQLHEELSATRISLTDVQERNENVAEELADCRSKLQSAVNEREDLQNQLFSVKAEAGELSARAYELQLSLEKSREELSSVLLELADCKDMVAVLQGEKDNLSGMVSSLTEDRGKLLEEKESWLGDNEELSLELADCKSLVAALQWESSNQNETIASITEERKKLEEDKESLIQENVKLSTQWTDSKHLEASLLAEVSNLQETLALVTEEKKNFEEQRMNFIRESEKLTSEVKLLQEQLSTEHAERMQVEVNLKELTMHLEQLSKENSNIREIDDSLACRQSQIAESPMQNASLEVSSSGLEKPLCDADTRGVPNKPCEQDLVDDSVGFAVLKRHVEETENILQNLEKAIEGVHAHTVSLIKSSPKMAAQGVSKLIQAFESKGHHENEGDESSFIGDKMLADTFALTKEQMGKLRAVLKLLESDTDKGSVLFKDEREKRKTASTEYNQLKVENEALKKQTDDLIVTNIELGVMYEVVQQHMSGIELKYSELEVLCELLKQHELSFEAKNYELTGRLTESESRMNELQSQLHESQRSSDEVAAALQKQLEILQKEAAEKAMTLELEWSSTVAQMVETVGRLDDSVSRLSVSAVSSGSVDNLDTNGRICFSVDAAIKMIEDLQGKIESARIGHETVCNSYEEVKEKFNQLLRKDELATSILQSVFADLRKLVIDMCGPLGEFEMTTEPNKLHDLVAYDQFKTLMKQLEHFIDEKMRLEAENHRTNSELVSKIKNIEEMNTGCLDLPAIHRLIEDVEAVVNPDAAPTNLGEAPGSRLESAVAMLLQKCREGGEQVSSRREDLENKVTELQNQLQNQILELNALIIRHETEAVALRENLRHAEEALTVARSELHEKVSELEQSEQRVTSVREKLGIAVAKGKGLVVQRDSLKQEMQLRDARLLELEAKLKIYSEAGERVEALESELSYIRNSATALRESFLLKDSVLQRVEEILEELDLPENFHERDIIEKVDWLARSAMGNSIPVIDADQKSPVGGPRSDTGFVAMDGWKEDAQESSNSGDDLVRRYEELKNRFYGLAEQNEMLEQSLLERNHMIQRWEELLDKISMPSYLRSVEPEGRIEWLGTALSEANLDRDSLQLKIDNLEKYTESLSAGLEDSQKRISTLEADLRAVSIENDNLSEKLESLTVACEKLTVMTVQLELEKEKLLSEMNDLEEKLAENVANQEHIQSIEADMRRLQGLVIDALKISDTEELVSDGSSTECLELLLRRLLEDYIALGAEKAVPVSTVGVHHSEKVDANLDESSRDILVPEETEVASLKKEIEDALHDLLGVKEERDRYMEKLQYLTFEFETLNKRKEEVQELLNQEEQKSTYLREKLNVAVRKGKSLMQQRDSLNQTIEEMSTEQEHLKSEIKKQEAVLSEYELKIRDLSICAEGLQARESENLLLRQQLTETQNFLQEREYSVSLILNTLGNIDVDAEVNASDPVVKLERVGFLFHDLRAAVASSEQESKKSKKAAELLLAELNEVQERNDSLQEKLAEATDELAAISKERDVAVAGKIEVLSHLDKLSRDRWQEKNKQYSEFMPLKSGAELLRESFIDLNSLLGNAFLKDLEYLHNLGVNMEYCLQRQGQSDTVSMPLLTASGGIIPIYSEEKENPFSVSSWSDGYVQEHFDENFMNEVCGSIRTYLQEVLTDISSLKGKLQRHSVSLHEQAGSLFEVVQIIQREMTSQQDLLQAMKKDIKSLEHNVQEKDMEIVVLYKNLGILYDACASSVMEIDDRRAEVVGNNLVAGDSMMTPNHSAFADGGQARLSSEECVKTVAGKLLLAVKDFSSLKSETMEVNQKELKLTIANLQKELQEKDIQKERICMELVNQIKEAEAACAGYSRELQSSEIKMHDLENQVKVLEEERSLMEHRGKELQYVQATTTELQNKVSSLAKVLAAKDQEIEALMQALDEEEVQMEDLRSKIQELEKVVQQKDADLDNLDTVRGKIAKKLSVTVSRFDELHHLSENLLAEVEKLQSQLQDRDAEISFLRQEVTRCTNDVLVASQMSNKKTSEEIHEFLGSLDSVLSRVEVDGVNHDEARSNVEAHEYKELLKKKIMSVLSELENTRTVAQSRDTLLQVERSKVEELTRKAETLEKFIEEKQCQVDVLGDVRDSGQSTSLTSEIVEVEPVLNKWTVPGTASQVRSLRKVNNDQVAIAIDTDPDGGNSLEDEDEDKVHGFRSLTTSRIVPKFTRPVSDLVDGLWVSCDRALQRQPVLRLSIILYWAVLHALVAAFVV